MYVLVQNNQKALGIATGGTPVGLTKGIPTGAVPNAPTGVTALNLLTPAPLTPGKAAEKLFVWNPVAIPVEGNNPIGGTPFSPVGNPKDGRPGVTELTLLVKFPPTPLSEAGKVVIPAGAFIPFATPFNPVGSPPKP